MNKNKIREALELAARLTELNPNNYGSDDVWDSIQQIRELAPIVDEALAELDKAPNDERPWMNEWQRNMCKKSKGVLIRLIEEERAECDRLRNEAPAAGLTVEEVMDIMDELTGDRPESFRARLTAAIEAKQAKP